MERQLRRGSCWRFFWAAYIVVCVSLKGADLDEIRAAMLEVIESAPKGYFNGYNSPTDPLEGVMLLPEWEETAGLFLNVNPAEILENEPLKEAYRGLIGTAAQYVPVWVGYNGNDSRFALRLEDALTPENANFPIELVDSKSNSYWVRDYSPVFGYSPNGTLLVVDTIYSEPVGREDLQSLETSSGEATTLELFGDQLQRARSHSSSDLMALAMMKALRQSLRIESEAVRPPMFLQVSDYQSDGTGSVYVTEESVLQNGGRLGQMKSLADAYFGANELVVLETATGMGPSSLGDTFKLLKPDFAVIARPYEGAELNVTIGNSLTRHVNSVYDGNFRRLTNSNSRLKISTLPSLTPIAVLPSPAEYQWLRRRLVEVVATKVGVDAAAYLALPLADSRRKPAEKLIQGYLSKAVGEDVNLYSNENLDTAIRIVFGKSTTDVLSEAFGNRWVARSYTSSLFLRTKSQGLVVLLPRYAARNEEEITEIRSIESQVAQVYREAYPEITIKWIDVDQWVERGGSLHRVALSIPTPKRST